MGTLEWGAICFVVGIVLGAWVTKHPEDAHGYLESAVAKVKSWFKKAAPKSP